MPTIFVALITCRHSGGYWPWPEGHRLFVDFIARVTAQGDAAKRWSFAISAQGTTLGDTKAQEKFDPSISAEGRFRVYCRVANVTHVSTDRLNQILDKIGEGQGLSPKRRHEIILESKTDDSQCSPHMKRELKAEEYAENVRAV